MSQGVASRYQCPNWRFAGDRFEAREAEVLPLSYTHKTATTRSELTIDSEKREEEHLYALQKRTSGLINLNSGRLPGQREIEYDSAQYTCGHRRNQDTDLCLVDDCIRGKRQFANEDRHREANAGEATRAN